VDVTWWRKKVQAIPSGIREHRAGTIHVLDSGSAFDRYPEFRFPKNPRSNGMKTTVLATLLAWALAAGAQDATQQPAQPAAPGGAPAGQSDQAPTIKDPAEYNAYVNAVQQQDPNGKVSALEAFLTQYPNSVMKPSALELLMGTYQQTGNQAKVVETAKRLQQADPNNLRALALLTFLARQGLMSNQNPQQNLADLAQYCQKGLDAIKANQKPAGMKDADFEKLKKDTSLLFNGGCGFAALQNKDFPKAQEFLKAAVDQEPNDLQNVYPLATAYNSATPPDSLNAIFYLARAAGLAPAGSQAQQQIQAYGRTVYKNYHGSDQGWTDYALPSAKTATNPPADWGEKITKYVPPTPAQQAHELVNGKTPEQIQQLSFGEWELVLSAGVPEDQAKVWDVIKNKPLQMEGSVMEAPSDTELHIAGSADDIEAKRPDIVLTMSGPIPKLRMPKVGDAFDFEGSPTSYTATPFMMQMSDGKLLKKAGEKPKPTTRKPVHRRPATSQ
jgi:tetratricopeptide (TPR) repeat protein